MYMAGVQACKRERHGRTPARHSQGSADWPRPADSSPHAAACFWTPRRLRGRAPRHPAAAEAARKGAPAPRAGSKGPARRLAPAGRGQEPGAAA
jgi:hypothetical protein